MFLIMPFCQRFLCIQTLRTKDPIRRPICSKLAIFGSYDCTLGRLNEALGALAFAKRLWINFECPHSYIHSLFVLLDFSCPGNRDSTHTIEIKPGDSFSYNTNPDDGNTWVESGSSLENVSMHNEQVVLQLPRQHEVSGDVQAGVRLQEDEIQLHWCRLAEQRWYEQEMQAGRLLGCWQENVSSIRFH